MTKIRSLFLLFLIIIFLFGLYVTMFHESFAQRENMETSDCPDLLVKENNVLLLYNTKLPKGKNNPIPFFNLDEYINYLEGERRKGKKCPILFLQQETNAQGKNVYRVRKNPFDQEGGLPTDFIDQEKVSQRLDASRDSPPYNTDMYPSFDPMGLHIGDYTEVDAVHDMTSKRKISDNPMDKNWAGITYTQQMVDTGKYEKRELTKPTLFNPKGTFYKEIEHPNGPPKDFL